MRGSTAMELKTESKGANKPDAKAAAKQTRPLVGFVIAGASLAALFGLAVLKGRVKDKR
jgi:hypothetical protein